MYTHSVQLVDFRHDQYEEKGEVDVERAVAAFRSFPFKEQQERAQSLSAATFPTVSFRNQDDGSALAIWSLEPGEYEIYLEAAGKKVTVNETSEAVIEGIIRDFFCGERESLVSRLSRSPRSTAVSSGGILSRLKGLLGLTS